MWINYYPRMKTDLVRKATHSTSSATGVKIYREPTTGTKRKYNGKELYQEGIGKKTVK
jgi:hypothetical protein